MSTHVLEEKLDTFISTFWLNVRDNLGFFAVHP